MPNPLNPFDEQRDTRAFHSFENVFAPRICKHTNTLICRTKNILNSTYTLAQVIDTGNKIEAQKIIDGLYTQLTNIEKELS